ncbi:siderophore-interacting protein [Cellulomonas sp. NS3]|uniref:siderophore-interacting protein n=1 Tax=Cellulomonas sp. NS3 TaxID=2973977 RepID=UPI002162D48E|nr:siderophore-interacting protein [Cellulomonas sp. NS3]
MTELLVAPTIAPFRAFAVRVVRIQDLTPSFRRITFTGDDLDVFADNGRDQRIKLILARTPGDDVTTSADCCAALDTLLAGEGGLDWFTAWREAPDAVRPVIRTYTIAGVRQHLREIDVDVVLHGDLGPASRWAGSVRVGDTLGVCGPDARHPGPHGGVEWAPPEHALALLLAGDETAVPAIRGILASLPADARGEAVLEIPHAADVLPLRAPAGVRVTWLAREDAPHGSALVPAVQAAAGRLLDAPVGGAAAVTGAIEDVDVDAQILWEVPVDPDGEPLTRSTEMYAWLAGEAGAIKTLRRHLVAERGVDRRSVAFMGYWREGRAEGA